LAYYLGIDGGGSKTACAVGDESSLIASSVAGPCNITRVGEVRARESLHQAIREACAKTKIEPQQVGGACVGIAGAGRKAVASAIRKIVAELLGGEIEVVGDTAIALQAAFGAGPGVIVIAGTGSIAYGRNAQGATARAGGWGFTVSDEGSAHWIGRTAVSEVLRTGDPETLDSEKTAAGAAESLSLFRELKAAWRLRSLDDFVRTANSNPDFASLFPVIVAAADAGDALAQRVLAQAGAELSRLAGIVIRRISPGQDASSLAVWLSMAGGVFRHSARVRERFRDEVRKLYPQANVNPQIIEPVAGALQMARQFRAASVK
jgi:glucosamine kinase